MKKRKSIELKEKKIYKYIYISSSIISALCASMHSKFPV